jgi:hypothetical protein
MFGLHEANPHVHLGFEDVFPERAGHFLEFGGNKKPIDVMVPWAFVVYQKLDLIHTMFQDFLPRFAPWA